MMEEVFFTRLNFILTIQTAINHAKFHAQRRTVKNKKGRGVEFEKKGHHVQLVASKIDSGEMKAVDFLF